MPLLQEGWLLHNIIQVTWPLSQWAKTLIHSHKKLPARRRSGKAEKSHCNLYSVTTPAAYYVERFYWCVTSDAYIISLTLITLYINSTTGKVWNYTDAWCDNDKFRTHILLEKQT